MKLIKRIKTLIQISELESNKPNAYIFLPEIIETLKVMHEILENKEYSKVTREELIGGLGKLITDDYHFSESDLGTEIRKIASDFLKQND